MKVKDKRLVKIGPVIHELSMCNKKKCSTYGHDLSNDKYNRFLNALRNLPAPGTGCHPKLLSAANYGVAAGLFDNEIFSSIRKHIPVGDRHVKDQEIIDAINKARSDQGKSKVENSNFGLQTEQRPSFDTEAVLNAIMDKGKGIGEPDFSNNSPIKIPSCENDSNDHTARFLRYLYSSNELLFIGDLFDSKKDSIRTVSDWLESFKHGFTKPNFIIPNPLTGNLGKTKTGKDSYRADNCIKNLQYCIAEFDNLPKAKQYEFWAGLGVPIVALIDSGGKSLHAWLRVDCPDFTTWNTEIKVKLYKHSLEPFGVDPACKNPSSLSRLPGSFREDKNSWQRLVYLAPEGGVML